MPYIVDFLNPTNRPFIVRAFQERAIPFDCGSYQMRLSGGRVAGYVQASELLHPKRVPI